MRTPSRRVTGPSAITLRCRALPAAALMLAAAPALAVSPPTPNPLERLELPAAGRQETIVAIPAFGRYALVAMSAQGTALQHVDRMFGPGQVAGSAGEQDGRLDLFLDRGEYKVVTLGHERAAGNVALKVHGFEELNEPRPPLLVDLKLVTASVADFQQVSYWLDVAEPRRVAIEAAGRHLADLRLWRDGTWLVDATPEREVLEPSKGRPLLACRLTVELPKGLYLLTAYGGPGQPWAEGGDETPLYVRSGTPSLPTAGRRRMTVSPFGVDRFRVPGDATFFRLELPEARPAQLSVGPLVSERPFRAEAAVGGIDKTSLPPATELEVGPIRDGAHLVTVRAEAGQPYVLQHFEKRHEYAFKRSGPHWISTVHSGPAADSVDATAIIARWTPAGLDREPFRDQVIEVDSSHGWSRRCNLLDELTVFLHVGATGKYEVLSRGTAATFRIEPFFVYRPRSYQAPPARPGGSTWELDAGYYVLTAYPEKKGILDVVVRPTGLLELALDLIGRGAAAGASPLAAAARFGPVELSTDHSYVMYLNRQPGVAAGVVLRPLPLDLTEALPLAVLPGETVEVPFQAHEREAVTAETEDGSPVDVALDGATPQRSATVEPGAHVARVRNTAAATVLLALRADPIRLLAGTPLPDVPDALLAALPEFPVLAADAPHFIDLARGAGATFLVRAEAPALYRLESSGLLATAGNLRTRTVLSLDRREANGVGRNFLVQQFLREGDYQLTVNAVGASAGHLGVSLARTPVSDGGTLALGVPARVSLPSGHGVEYRFTIPEKGVYRVRALGLGKQFRCRLEDAAGWPLERPGIGADITRELAAGDYRLVLLPEDVASRRVTLLERVLQPERLAGHGPHPLALERAIEHVWLEPEDDGGERAPDVWELAVPAPVKARIELSGEMQGDLRRAADRSLVASVPPGRGFAGELAAGAYRLEVVCSRRNNQVGYRLAVWPEQLVAGLERAVAAPATVPLSVGRAGLIELASFGDADVRAELLDAEGHPVARGDDRPDDWNFHLAARLDPGFYTLRVHSLGRADARCEVAMRELAEVVEPPLAAPGRREVATGSETHVFPLTLPSGAGLLVVTATAAESLGCAIEAQAGGEWRSLATRVGHQVRLALPVGPPLGALRTRLWSVDRRGLPVTIAVAAATPATSREAAFRAGVSLAAIPGTEPRLAAAAVELDRPGVFRPVDAPEGLLASEGVGDVARAVEDAVGAPGRMLWLLAERAGPLKVRADRVVLAGGHDTDVRVRLAAETPLACDVSSGAVTLVRATALAGAPVVRVVDRVAKTDVSPTWLGRFAPSLADLLPKGAMRAAEDAMMTEIVTRHAAAAVALAPEKPVALLWQGDRDAEPAEVRLELATFALGAAEPFAGGTATGMVAPSATRVVALPPGGNVLRLTLASGITAALLRGQRVASVHWAHDEPLAETLASEADRLVLLNPEATARSWSVTALPGDAAFLGTLSPERPFESEEIAAGVLRLALPRVDDAAASPLALHLRGAVEEAVLLASDGRVVRGRDLAAVAGGTLLVRHGRGRVLAWLDRPGALGDALWGVTANVAVRPVAPPLMLALAGRASAVRVDLGAPVMLHLRAAAPLVTRLLRPGGPPEVEVHSDGTSLDAYLPAGAAELALRALGAGALSGTAEITTTPLAEIGEGLGAEMLLPPGATRGFTFAVTREGPIGVGARADSDRVECTLIDEKGHAIGSGAVIMARLARGRYVLALHAPADSPAILARPALVGVSPPGTGPPEEVMRRYLRLARGEPEEEPAAAETSSDEAAETEQEGEGEAESERPGDEGGAS